jgi:hypothetical protein
MADDDGQPQTCIEVDGGQATCARGSHVMVEVASSGIHSVRYWARDLAGNQPAPDQVHTATVKVDLSLSSLDLWLKAKRRVRAGKKVTFTGAARAPQSELNLGKLVEIQAKVGKRWKTVGEAFRTDANGTFVYKYRFRKFYTRPTRYKFRLKVAPEPGWPYAEPLYSAKRKVKVVPRKGKRRK